MKSRNKNSFLLLALIWLPNTVQALSNDRDQPIFIEAEQVEVNKLKGFSRYQGQVKFVQGSLIIRGETVLLYHKNGAVDKIIIHGKPASFQQQPDKGGISIVSSANKIEYIAKQSRLFLFESAKVSQGNNSFSGEKIEYDMVKGTVVANKGSSSKNRIHAIIEQEKTTKVQHE